MSEKRAFEFSVEIDPNYVRQTEPDPNAPARIATKRAWFMSLLIPVLAILASMYPFLFFPSTILGVIVGGVVPLVMIIRGRIDTSKFFLGKMILLAATVGGIILVVVTYYSNSWLNEDLCMIITPIVLALAEIIFAATRKTVTKTKVCLALSSVAWVYLGATVKFSIAFRVFG